MKEMSPEKKRLIVFVVLLCIAALAISIVGILISLQYHGQKEKGETITVQEVEKIEKTKQENKKEANTENIQTEADIKKKKNESIIAGLDNKRIEIYKKYENFDPSLCIGRSTQENTLYRATFYSRILTEITPQNRENEYYQGLSQLEYEVWADMLGGIDCEKEKWNNLIDIKKSFDDKVAYINGLYWGEEITGSDAALAVAELTNNPLYDIIKLTEIETDDPLPEAKPENFERKIATENLISSLPKNQNKAGQKIINSLANKIEVCDLLYRQGALEKNVYLEKVLNQHENALYSLASILSEGQFEQMFGFRKKEIFNKTIDSLLGEEAKRLLEESEQP
jgi:hypothetical protein